MLMLVDSSVAGKFSGLPRFGVPKLAMTGEGVEEDADGVASGDGVPQF